MCWDTYANEFLAPLDGNNYFVDLQPNPQQLTTFLPHDNYYNSYAVFVQKNDIFCSVFYYPLCNLFYVLLHLQLQSCTAVHLSILVK